MLADITNDEIILTIQSYMVEAKAARQSRDRKNKENFDMYLGKQDWTGKKKGQSKEFLPKIPLAVELFSSSIKKALTDFGDWFRVTIRNSDAPPILTADNIRDILKLHFRKTNLITTISDGAKIGLLKSLTIFKIHGAFDTHMVPFIDIEDGESDKGNTGATSSGSSGKLSYKEFKSWRLLVELIRPEDFYIDPFGRNLYQIHETFVDLYTVQEKAEKGIYDKEEVAKILGGTEDENAQAKSQDQNQSSTTPNGFRKPVKIWEMFGTLLGRDGAVVARNVLITIADGKYVLRKIKSPFWHLESPFVSAPLIRVPFSTYHKALYDHSSSLNKAINEIFNLILDGGIASVWGIKELRQNALANKKQLSGGITHGTTILTNDSLPPGAKALSIVKSGEVPRDALNTFTLLDREFQAASLVNDIKLGLLPQKQVKATEIVESINQSSALLDGIVKDIESELIEPMIYKSWTTILQNANNFQDQEIIDIIGEETALKLSVLSPEERYVMFAQSCNFQAFGLSEVISKAKDFQKIITLLDVLGNNPFLQQVLEKEFSAAKIVKEILVGINLNPEKIKFTSVELKEKLKQERTDKPFGRRFGTKSPIQGARDGANSSERFGNKRSPGVNQGK